ncbi:hypothetical protein LINGRAHAP2_LOCUS31648, partial [Linum grandiflorum]
IGQFSSQFLCWRWGWAALYSDGVRGYHLQSLPKSNALTITIPGVALALSFVSYLWATLGVASGFFDMFVLAFVERLFRPIIERSAVVLL